MLTNNDIEFGELCRNSWAKQTSKPITQREIEFAREIIVAYQAKNLEGTTMTLQDTMRFNAELCGGTSATNVVLNGKT